jgi:hypothetical protein
MATPSGLALIAATSTLLVLIINENSLRKVCGSNRITDNKKGAQ